MCIKYLLLKILLLVWKTKIAIINMPHQRNIKAI